MKNVTKLALFAGLCAGLAGPAAGQTPRATQRPSYTREVPARLLRQAKVGEDSALKVATARIPPPATVKALELENEGGELIWSFDFFVPNLPGLYEVHVSALTGALVGKVEHELPTTARRDTTRAAAPAKPRP